MKRFAVALALIPAVSHAGLIVTDAPAAKPVSVAQMAPTILPDAAPAHVGEANSGFVDLSGASSEAAPAPSPIKIVEAPQLWVAHQGSTLRESIEAWAKSANWKVNWNARQGDRVVNYPIREADVRIQGTIETAVADFIRLYEQAPAPLKVAISPSQRLFIISLKH